MGSLPRILPLGTISTLEVRSKSVKVLVLVTWLSCGPGQQVELLFPNFYSINCQDNRNPKSWSLNSQPGDSQGRTVLAKEPLEVVLEAEKQVQTATPMYCPELLGLQPGMMTGPRDQSTSYLL